MSKITSTNKLKNKFGRYIILVYILLISTAAIAQNIQISITGHDITIKQAFEQIEVQSKYTIAYNQTKFNTEKKNIVINQKRRFR